jgi:hypothetical protein
VLSIEKAERKGENPFFLFLDMRNPSIFSREILTTSGAPVNPFLQTTPNQRQEKEKR